MTTEALSAEVRLFPVRAVYSARPGNLGQPFAEPVFQAKNASFRALFTTWVRAPLRRKLRLSVADAAAQTAYQFELDQSANLHRQTWSLDIIPRQRVGCIRDAVRTVEAEQSLGDLPAFQAALETSLHGRSTLLLLTMMPMAIAAYPAAPAAAEAGWSRNRPRATASGPIVQCAPAGRCRP